VHRKATTFPTRDGLRLAADVAGDGARGVLILAHGGGQTRHSWVLAGKRLADRGWKTVTVDLRGHGDSDWAPDGDYRVERFAEDLIDIAATFPAKPALIGASLGGREIEIPVHLIRGRLSELVSLEAAWAFVATLRNGVFTDVAGAGHMVAGDRNDVFLDAVTAFFDRSPR